MDEKLNQTVVRYGCSVEGWLNKNSFKFIMILSLLHIGLAYIHTQHSGRADYCFFLCETDYWQGSHGPS